MNIEHTTNQKEITFSLLKGGKLRGKQKWPSGTGQCWKLGSATTVTLLDHGTVPHFKTHLRNAYTQLRKLSTLQRSHFFSKYLPEFQTTMQPPPQEHIKQKQATNLKKAFSEDVMFATFKFIYCSNVTQCKW
jgi:hypothetical protein